MIHEIIENVYVKTDSDGYIDERTIQTMEKNFYEVRIFGFEKFNALEISNNYTSYIESDLKGLKILHIGSNGAGILIELSNKTFLRFEINGMGNATYYLNISNEEDYDDLKMLMENNMQKLSQENTYTEFNKNR